MRLLETTKALSVRSSSRCGDRGLRMLGFHFTAEPKVLVCKDLSPGVLDKILRHAELDVVQLERTPYEKPAATTIAAGDDATLPGVDPSSSDDGVKPQRRKKPKRKIIE